MYSTPTAALSPAERADLHDRARRHANALRGQAVDAFWYGIYRTAVTTLRAARAHLARLAQMAHLSRHPSGV